jgi:Na+-translocating ferredoxin:NAD+ oxidoreductase RNF subunit RnfB
MDHCSHEDALKKAQKVRFKALVDEEGCFGSACEYCIHACPVENCIVMVPEADGFNRVARVNWDICIGCRQCVRRAIDDIGCPYDTIEMINVKEFAAAS